MAECPTLAHAGAASSLAVPGQGPRPVPRGGPHPRGQPHCSTGDGGRTSERRGSEQTQEERGHFSGQCMRGNGEKGEVVLCWGRAKTQGRRNPPGESARTRGLPGPRRACQGQAASVCPSLGGRTPRPRHCLQRGRAPAPLLLSIQPLRGPPWCPAAHATPACTPPSGQGGPDRVDRQSRFPLQPPRPAASPRLCPALTWASQVTSQALGNLRSRGFPRKGAGAGLATVGGGSAVSNRGSLSPRDVPATRSSISTKATFRFESTWSGARPSSASAPPLTADYRPGSPEKAFGVREVSTDQRQ